MMFRKLGIWIKGQEHISLDRILVPDDPADIKNTTWTAVLEAQALYKLLTQEGQKHYGQTSPTPFVTGPIANLIGPFSNNAHCDAILNGTFDFTDIEATVEVHDIVEGMQYPDPTNPTPTINTTITAETFSDMVTHSRERTSSSPSGRHYGIYCALLQNPALLGHIAALANFCFH